ncbi:Uncharacterized protein ToN1_25270 [Aromatoleum petrolei]|nr:Uncharacterized protein ToN1_25270 [Aromatoleum petrolei]
MTLSFRSAEMTGTAEGDRVPEPGTKRRDDYRTSVTLPRIAIRFCDQLLDH